jgi:hypothetical protein
MLPITGFEHRTVFAAGGTTVITQDGFLTGSIPAGHTVIIEPGVRVDTHVEVRGQLLNSGIIRGDAGAGEEAISIMGAGRLVNNPGGIIVTAGDNDVYLHNGNIFVNYGSVFGPIINNQPDLDNPRLINQLGGFISSPIHRGEIVNLGIIACTSPELSVAFSGNAPLLDSPFCDTGFGLFEENAADSLEINLGEIIRAIGNHDIVATITSTDELEELFARIQWIDPDNDVAKEIWYEAPVIDDRFKPNKAGTWTAHMEIYNGTAVNVISSASLDFEVIDDGGGGIEALNPFTDFNGDGYGDLAIGVPNEDLGPVLELAGAVNVIYGSPVEGLSATVVPDQFWSQNSFGVEGNPEPFDQFGKALATGDFNSDGFSDLAICVPNEGIGARAGAGGVNVIYGSASGLSADEPDDRTGRADQFWSQNSAGISDDSVNGEGFGDKLATGDFNNDGYSDLAIGVPNQRVGDHLQAGAIHIIYGSSDGLSAFSLASDGTGMENQYWTQDSPDIENDDRINWGIPASLSASDFNADGFDDLAFGSRQEYGVEIIYGSPSGLSATFVPNQFITQDSPGMEGDSNGEDAFGYSTMGGDFNGDGFDDLAIGAPGDSETPPVEITGSVAIVYGSPAGLSATYIPDQLWTQNSANVEGTAEFDDGFGFSLARGDFNSDGFDDLVIGVPREDIPADDGGEDAGVINIIYGSTNGLSVMQSSDGTGRSDQMWSQNHIGVNQDAETLANFGSALASGDFNGDGNSDLAIGVFGADIKQVEFAGGVHILYGSVRTTYWPWIHQQFWSQDSFEIRDHSEFNDRFAYSLAASS